MIRRLTDPVVLGVVWAVMIASVLLDVALEWRRRNAVPS